MRFKIYFGLLLFSTILSSGACRLFSSPISLQPKEFPGIIDVAQWLREAEPLNDGGFFHTGYVPFGNSVRKMGGDVMDLGRGFSGEKTSPEDNLSFTWTADSLCRYLIFVTLEDIGTTGEESIAFYKNDEHLGTYTIGARNSLLYAYPYDRPRAMERGIPVWDRPNNGKQIGVVLRRRRQFSKGDQLRIEAQTPGRYNMTSVMLVPWLHTVEISDHEILHPKVKLWQKDRLPADNNGLFQFAWVTRMPSRSTLIWNTDRDDIEAGRGNIFKDAYYADNHQYYADVEPGVGESVYYRILAESNDGRRTVTPVLTYTRAPLPVQSSAGSITLSNIDRVDTPQTPAYGSIPMEQGLLYDTGSLSLKKFPGDIPVPAQFRVVSCHRDNSVRWLGVDFTADPDNIYVLKYGPGVHGDTSDGGDQAGGILLERSNGSIKVYNRFIGCVFSDNAPAGLERLDIFTQEGTFSFSPENMRLYMTGSEGRRFTAGAPQHLHIEQSGPQHVSVRAEGHFLADDGEPLMHYVMRWQIYRDKPGLAIEIRVGNDRDEDKYSALAPEEEPSYRTSSGEVPGSFNYTDDKPLNWYFVNIKNLYLELDMPGEGRVSVGIDSKLKEMDGDIRLFQRDEDTLIDESGALSHARFVTVIEEETELSSPARLDGRLLWRGSGLSAGVKFDRFWQNYPKSYEMSGNTIRIGIMPSYNQEYYPLHGFNEETGVLDLAGFTARIYYYLRQGKYRMAYGKQKTHHLSLLFGDEAEERISSECVIPPVALYMPLPEYKCSVRSVGDFQWIKADTGKYPAVSEWMQGFYDIMERGRNDGRDYGMFNLGDIWGRIRFWAGSQIDFAQAASREFWRTGRRDWLSFAYESAMHYADIDTVNYGPHKGAIHISLACHSGPEYLTQEGFDIAGWPAGRSSYLNSRMMRIMGIRNLALISGSGRLMETVVQFAEVRARANTFIKSIENSRSYDLTNTFVCYEVESNPFYLNAARIAFERMYIDMSPLGGYVGVPAGYKEVTGDIRVDEVVKVRAMASARMWDEHLKITLVNHTGRGGRSVYTNPQMQGAEAYMITGDPKYREILRESTAYSLSAPSRNWAPQTWRALTPGAVRGRPQGLSSLTYYLDAAGIEEIEPIELPGETIEILESWGGTVTYYLE